LSITATKTVDCSFIKAEHSTQVSSKNNSRKNTCIAGKQFAVPPPVSESFHLPFVEQSQVLAHLLFAAQCIKNTVFEGCKTTSLIAASFLCFRVLLYRINTHALEMLFNSKIIRSSFDWLGFCSQI
jgi:hypothetical protein